MISIKSVLFYSKPGFYVGGADVSILFYSISVILKTSFYTGAYHR